VPSALENPTERFAWSLLLRDLSFAAGAWSLAGLYSRASSPQQSKWMILFGRIAIAIAAIFFGVEHFLHPNSAPGIPLPMMTPTWVPFPNLWAYLAGAILLAAGIALALDKKPRIAATSIGALMTALTVFLYLPILILARGESEVIVGLNYVADTLLYAGAALLLASALPRDPDRWRKRSFQYLRLPTPPARAASRHPSRCGEFEELIIVSKDRRDVSWATPGR